MTFSNNFFWYEEGFPGARFDGSRAPLGWLLENELREGPQACDEILSEIQKIEAGLSPGIEIDGNQSVVDLRSGSAKIANHYFDPPRTITLPLWEFRNLLEEWKTFLSSCNTDQPNLSVASDQQKRKFRIV